ncbi:hypothetical protein HJ590_13220 [Naumannella sp. ID2617S]|nr:hypothetical protein [Naumannella sp. ID2617S]
MVMRSTTARGYGTQHQAERRRWAKRIKATGIPCTCTRDTCPHHQGQCPTIIVDGMAWDLGHTDDRTAYTGPECVPCNRSAGGRNAAAKTNAAATMTIREWPGA